MGDETVLTSIEMIKKKLKKYIALQEHGKVNWQFSSENLFDGRFLSGKRICTEITSFTIESFIDWSKSLAKEFQSNDLFIVVLSQETRIDRLLRKLACNKTASYASSARHLLKKWHHKKLLPKSTKTDSNQNSTEEKSETNPVNEIETKLGTMINLKQSSLSSFDFSVNLNPLMRIKNVKYFPLLSIWKVKNMFSRHRQQAIPFREDLLTIKSKSFMRNFKRQQRN